MTPQERNLKRYPQNRYTLIPLHKPADTRTKNGIVRKLGKAPIDKNWTKATYDTASTIKRCVEEKRNVGVRLRGDQVVIDIDPRNGGDVSYLELFATFGVDESIFPRVVTGSGGLHLYATKPKNIPIMDSLGDEYAGVEFKSRGRQVVAPGSIHPDTNKPYLWDDNYPDIMEAPPLPNKLLKLITKPLLSTKLAGGGEYDQEQIARMLDHLDARKFSEQRKWLNVMMAVHHSSNGDARSEFIEWSITDPQYKNDASAIGRRWDSLHRGKADGIKSGTLDMYMREAGATNAIPYKGAKGIAADEFFDPDIDSGIYLEADEAADEDEFDFDEVEFDFDSPDDADPKAVAGADDDGIEASEPFTKDSRARLKELNDKYTWVLEAGHPKIVYSEFDPVLERRYWSRMRPEAFEKHFSNVRLERNKKAAGMGKNASDTIPLGKAWTEWTHRNQKEGIIFLPSNEQIPGYLNLWDGWQTVASTSGGSWDKLKELMLEGICSGNQDAYQYLIRWCAYMFQYPENNAETTIAVRGGKGTGKGTLGNTLAKVIGRHALHISSAGHLTGRFNAHLQDCVFLFSDEAIVPYDKHAESVLKSLITEPTITVERKGIDPIQGKNFLHIYMASNDKWVVPAGMDGERRFFVLEASNKYQGKHSFFKELRAELDAGGYERFLGDMMAEPLPEEWHPRDLPSTQALIDQKVRGMGPLSTYFYNAICTRDFGAMPTRPDKGWDWETKPIRFFVQDFKQYFAEFCRSINATPGSQGRSNHQLLMDEIKELFPDARTSLRDGVRERHDIVGSPSDNRAPAIEIPKRSQCMEAFEKRLGGKPNWPNLEISRVKRKPVAADVAADFDFED